MLIEADTHCHTVASTHAYSTVMEMVNAAKDLGLKGIALTDHASAMPDAPHLWHFHNLKKCIPNKINGVYIMCGSEVNIIDYDGNLDFPEKEIKPLDWIVASMHIHVIEPTSISEISEAYIKMAKNPYVDVVGHCASPRFPFEYEKVLKVFKEYNKLVEINESSIIHKKGTKENYVEIIKLCKKNEIPIVVNSDAHICIQVGVVPNSEQMLKDLNFPNELIINSDWDKLSEYVKAKRGNIFE